MATTLHPVDQTVLASIRAIVEYDYKTEQDDYESQHPDDREGHVFLHLLRVATWLANAPAAFVHVVEVAERIDGTYVFADLDDAKAFEATVNAGDLDTFVVPSCHRTEETICDRSAALKLIAVECEATPEAEASSLVSGIPIAKRAWKRGEDAPYPDKLECVEYTVYPTDLDEFGQRVLRPMAKQRRIALWVGLHPDNGSPNVDAGRERLESEGWEVTDWGAA